MWAVCDHTRRVPCTGDATVVAVYASRARPLDRREAYELIEAEGGSLWAGRVHTGVGSQYLSVRSALEALR